jgi:hypothetical protein
MGSALDTKQTFYVVDLNVAEGWISLKKSAAVRAAADFFNDIGGMRTFNR